MEHQQRLKQLNMNLLSKISGKLFKANIRAEVDFHANGFFVKKDVSYLAFLTNGLIVTYNRTEGTHPYDTDLVMILDQISKGENVFEMEVALENRNTNSIELKSGDATFICIPSIFIQNLDDNPLTEFALCNQITGEVIIYQLWHDIK